MSHIPRPGSQRVSKTVAVLMGNREKVRFMKMDMKRNIERQREIIGTGCMLENDCKEEVWKGISGVYCKASLT